ncbi:hypothetical protein B7494_g4889 [Chlorociboria aeruginascens]|nr:hypothetical protein B7494_g4889 [Chlorociboria aeruginascens]
MIGEIILRYDLSSTLPISSPVLGFFRMLFKWAELSAYWTPQLYYQHANGSFEEVSNGGMAIYYLGRGADPAGNTVASPFPAGLKMLSGNNNARSFDNTTMTYSGDPNNPPTQVANRVTFACIDYNSPQAENPYMANTNCPDGLRAQIDFQSCWDGVNLYLSDQSHVDYLSSIDNGVCSPDYPVLLPHLFFEILYSVTNIVQDGGLFTFANGDETGYGFHGDFVNGWDLDVLSQAIDQCLLSDDGVIADCAPLAASDDVNFATDCVETSPVFPCEPVHGMIGVLPGCITPTGLDQPAENTCANGNVAACPPNYSNGPPAPYSGNGEYSYVGCYTEATSDRALSGSSESIPTMTAETCITFCEGAEYVGVEYGVECYCGTSLGSGSIAAAASDCAMTCGGSRWELCGGPNRLNLYKHT